MKKSLMATVAAIALLGGTSLALSEGMSPGSEQRGPAAGQSQQPTAQPGGPQQPGAQRGTTGQGSQQQPSMQKGDRPDRGAQREHDQQRRGAQREHDQQQRGAQQRDRRERSTTGQGTQQEPQQRQDRVQDSDRKAPGAGAQTETRDRSEPKSLTAEQKTKIRTTVISRAPKVSNVNFSLNVGTVVPRSVNIVAVPPTLIEIYPEWRGYRYFVVGDEIVIVEPRTLRIVAVLDV